MSTTLPFPMPLAEKYRPHAIADFVGLDKPKRILAKFAANPYSSAWLFAGPPGTGKTTMALALAETVRAELHHIPSQQCNVAAVEDVIRQCWYVPASGGFHLVLVDEADRMSNAAQLHFLSKLDATAFPPQTVFVFTCNTTDGLEPRFLSRTRQIEFSSYGLASEATRLLEGIWQREANGASAPNFARIVKETEASRMSLLWHGRLIVVLNRGKLSQANSRSSSTSQFRFGESGYTHSRPDIMNGG